VFVTNEETYVMETYVRDKCLEIYKLSLHVRCDEGSETACGLESKSLMMGASGHFSSVGRSSWSMKLDSFSLSHVNSWHHQLL
jgi:hypothetical protein